MRDVVWTVVLSGGKAHAFAPNPYTDGVAVGCSACRCFYLDPGWRDRADADGPRCKRCLRALETRRR